jgi:uncharacterized LabA/DUF88 family protein
MENMPMGEYTGVEAEKRSARHRRRSRRGCGAGVTLHLVDADNLLGDPTTVDRQVIDAVFEQYRRVSGYRSGDHVVIATGCNGLHVLEVELAWPGVVHRRRRGKDGADHVLRAEAESAVVGGAYDRVVIASGDREFMVAFECLLDAGFEVEVVAHHRRLARGFAALAHGRIRYFPTPHVAATELTVAA